MTPAARSLQLCLVTDRDLAWGRSLTGIVAAAVCGGVTMVQLREKTASTRVFLAEAQALVALLRPLAIPLIVNDRVDIALAADADGVHVGQDDMPVDRVRALLGPSKIVGLSITSLDDLRRSPIEAADYLGAGPIFAQATKRDAAAPLGLDGLAALRRETGKPLLAIGGVQPANAASVMHHGADGLAVVSAIMSACDPEQAARCVLEMAK